MILTRYIYREILASMTAVLSVLLLIYVSNRFVRFLADASSGDLSGGVIYQLLALKTLSASVMLVPLALYFAIILGLGRLYRDSEMVVLQACGLSPAWFVGRILVLAGGVAVAVGLVTLYLAPWAESTSDRIIDAQKAVPEAMLISPGRFVEIRKGNGVVYVERRSRDGRRMENVFIQLNENGREIVLSGPRAHIELRSEGRIGYLVVEDGLRYERRPPSSGHNLVRFREHALRIQQRPVAPSIVQTREMPTRALWASTVPAHVAELQWRLSMPLTVVLLALMAIPLSRSRPRSGRFGRIFVAILVYVLYNNLLGIAKSWVGQSRIPAEIGIWWVHGLVLCVALALMVGRSGVRRWFSGRRRVSGGAAG